MRPVSATDDRTAHRQVVRLPAGHRSLPALPLGRTIGTHLLVGLTVALAGVTVFRNGASAGPAARRRAAKRLEAAEGDIDVALGAGRGSAALWTCDLTTDYVRINAEYTT